MALRFFWTCAGTSLTAGVDYSVGDAVATGSGAPNIGATGAKVGSSGIYTTDATDYYYFDTSATLLAQIDEGALGFWIKIVGSMPGINGDIGVQITGDTSTTNAIKTRISATVASLYTYDSGGVSQSATATGTSLAADTWYFVVARWDFPNDKLGIEVYEGTSETPTQSAENTSATGTAPSELNSTSGVRIGNISSVTSVMYIDNVFIADAYDEPLHLYGNRDITDVDDYTITSTVKKLKLLAHPSAIGAGSVEGVVLNAARDTVIGEFTGQTFIDGSGESPQVNPGYAVLKVAATDISPDGATLTTSDTPLAIAYNATYTTPLVACTVIEE